MDALLLKSPVCALVAGMQQSWVFSGQGLYITEVAARKCHHMYRTGVIALYLNLNELLCAFVSETVTVLMF